MKEIQGKSILVRVSARFELARVRVIGGQLYLDQLKSDYRDIYRNMVRKYLWYLEIFHDIEGESEIFRKNIGFSRNIFRRYYICVYL